MFRIRPKLTPTAKEVERLIDATAWSVSEGGTPEAQRATFQKLVRAIRVAEAAGDSMEHPKKQAAWLLTKLDASK